LSLNAGGYYVGATTHITLGRLLGSALQGLPKTNCSSSTGDAHTLVSPSPSRSRSPICHEAKLPGTSLFLRDEADVLFDSYIKTMSTEYPIIHSKRLRDIHARRGQLQVAWEVAILHHVYAIGGRCLELVGYFPIAPCLVLGFQDAWLTSSDCNREATPGTICQMHTTKPPWN
jgi:hypothetical protein